MLRTIWINTFALILLMTSQAVAGPEGTYSVVGTNPGSGAQYRGVVSVKRNGQTYSVVWNVGGTEYLGTGLGAAKVKGTRTMGPASDQGTAIAISYVTNGSFGLTFYVQQSNGD